MIPIVVVPYRDRKEHLIQFLPSVKRFLPDARIFIVEQANNEPFNRGWLLNVGFLETEHLGDYWITHDVDMLPITVDYGFPEQPTHIATQCSQFNYQMPYPEYFGGVVLFTAEQFKTINGFVNSMKGWGAEDDIFYKSFVAKGYSPQRRACVFKSLPHDRPINWVDYHHNLEIWRNDRNFNDGLDTCHYTVVNQLSFPDYEHILVC